MQSCFLDFEFCLLKTHKKATQRSRRSARQNTNLTMTNSIFTASYQASLPTQRKLRGRGNKIVVGAVVKANIVELEEEAREGCPISMSNELTGVVQRISWKKRILARFPDWARKGSAPESTHHHDSREEPNGEGTQGSKKS